MSFKSVIEKPDISDNDDNYYYDDYDEYDDKVDDFSDYVSKLNIGAKRRKVSGSGNNKRPYCNKSVDSEMKSTEPANKKKRISENVNSNSTSPKIISKSNDCIIYSRCSTARQNQNKMQSLSTQVGLCIDYCVEKKLNVISILKDICEGHDISKLQLNEIPDKYSNINLVIADPSRMSRRITDADNFMTKCQENNITIHFVRDNLTVNTNENYIKAIGLVYDAFSESKLMSKRLKTTIGIRKKYGSYIGQPKFGYKTETYIDQKVGLKIRKLVPNENEQKIIEIINRLYFGSDINDFYTAFRKMIKNKKFLLKDLNDEPFDAIYYGNINYTDIADLLNENGIYKRDYEWTANSISNIVSKTENFDVKYYN